MSWCSSSSLLAALGQSRTTTDLFSRSVGGITTVTTAAIFTRWQVARRRISQREKKKKKKKWKKDAAWVEQHFSTTVYNTE
jgi:hypothetical protein